MHLTQIHAIVAEFGSVCRHFRPSSAMARRSVPASWTDKGDCNFQGIGEIIIPSLPISMEVSDFPATLRECFFEFRRSIARPSVEIVMIFSGSLRLPWGQYLRYLSSRSSHPGIALV